MSGNERKDNYSKPGGSRSGSLTTTPGPQILTLNTNKAGMDGLDTEKINEIIKSASKGSRFYQHNQKRQQELDIKLAKMKKEAARLTPEQIKQATLQMDELVRELESEGELNRTIVHVDMDMFYAAVEMRDDPSLRDKPMAVGSLGMLSTSNYAARRFGVRAAMPGFIGKKLCPDLVIVPLHFDKYRTVSRQVQEVFAEYDPNFSPMSLDEAYLDITNYLHDNMNTLQYEAEELDLGSAANRVVAEMREKIHTKTQLTASAGIACNTMLAKVCSDLNKPNGQYYLPPILDRIHEFVTTLPIRKVSGIGNVTEQHLHTLGITHCSHLMEKRGLLKLLFSNTSIRTFMRVALGQGHTSLAAWAERERKSISTETTFTGTSDKTTLLKLVENLCRELSEEMEQKGILGKVLTLKLKTTDFKIRSRAQTLADGTNSCQVLVTTAHRLLLHELNTSEGPLSLRLLGVRMSTLLNLADMGPNRQATLTQMFSKAEQNKTVIVYPSPTKTLLPHSLTINDTSCSEGKAKDVFNLTEISDSDVDKMPLRMESAKLSIEPSTIDKSESVVRMENQTKKKNMSIDCFLSKAVESSYTKKLINYECSVCSRDVNVKNLEEFNKHLDKCLEQNESVSQDSSLVKTDNNASVHTEDCNILWNKENNIEDNLESKNFEIQNKSLGFRAKEDYDYLSPDNETPCTTHKVSKSRMKYSCPVCEQKQFSDIDLLNKHMDECLNKSAINQILSDTVGEGTSSHSNLQTRPTQLPIKGKRKGLCIGTGKNNKKVKGTINTLDKYFS